MAATCPRCSAVAVENDKCAQCGVVASVYTAALEKMRRPPTPPPSAPVVVARATQPLPTTPTAVAVAPAPARSATNGSAAAAKAPIDITGASQRSLRFHGSGGTLFGIYVVNVLLTLVTLGWYRFWGKVRVRSFMLSQTSFEGDRFAYHGTGKELLLGFLKAVVFVGLPISALGMLAELTQDKMVYVGVRFFSSVLVLIFIPIAIVGAWRYRLSRTSWRGIRFSFRGRASAFIKVFVKGSLLSLVTASLYYPFFLARQQRFLISQTHFGRRPFHFDGRGRDLFGAYLLTLLLFLPTLGLYTFWFQAKKTRYFWEHTFFDTARFRCTVTGRQLMNLTIGNWVILILTLGLAWPWVVIRSAKFMFSYLTIAGPLDLDGIVQEPQLTTATGDALSSLLGADVDFA